MNRTTLAAIGLVALSSAHANTVLPIGPRQVTDSSLRFALLMLVRIPPNYASLTSTGTGNRPPPSERFQPSLTRCSMNRSVGWLTLSELSR